MKNNFPRTGPDGWRKQNINFSKTGPDEWRKQTLTNVLDNDKKKNVKHNEIIKRKHFLNIYTAAVAGKYPMTVEMKSSTQKS